MSLTPALHLLRGIGLAELNARAPLMSRTDRKYVVPQAAVADLLARLAGTHDVLELAGRREAAYSSVYFDSDDHRLHRAHVQGRRLRWKARTRLYTDSGLCFRELKVKGTRGSTDKLRQACPPQQHGVADGPLHAFVDAGLRQQYGLALELDLRPALTVDYSRSTLTSRCGQERVTIDRELTVSLPGRPQAGRLADGLALLEVKTPGGRSAVDRLLVALGHRPVSLSKYGVGLPLAQPAVRDGLPQLRRHFTRVAATAGPAAVPAWDDGLARTA